MKTAVGAGVLWAQRIFLIMAVLTSVALAVALAVWLILVDLQVLGG